MGEDELRGGVSLEVVEVFAGNFDVLELGVVLYLKGGNGLLGLFMGPLRLFLTKFLEHHD